ncbi:MAG: carbohydrate-binding family 9-like protein [Candidatus Hydrogenedentes bacterium]|nr:carbohydrate-binding family 9-like protein [Candidatus Hydrogenedentota bacterium]
MTMGYGAMWRRVGVCSIAALVLLACGWDASAGTRTVAFRCDGKAQEQKYLWKQDSRTFVLGGWGEPTRNLDGQGRFVIWRFDTTDASAARLGIRLTNSFALSASSDGEHFQEVLREEGHGGSNDGWKTADLSAFLPADFLYVRVEHGAPEKWDGGFGACLFEVRLELDDERDLAVARVAQTAAPIQIDGELDEPAWQNAQPLSTFTDRFLARPVTRGATFRLCYDATHWYLSAEFVQPGAPEAVVTGKERDSATYCEDAAEFFFVAPGDDGVPDVENGPHYHLAFNLLGVLFDELNADGGGTWNADVEVVVRRYLQGWTLEAALPAASMGVETLEPGQEWRIGLYRVDMGLAQFSQWSSTLGGGFHHRERFGRVTLVEAVDAPLPAVNLVLPEERALGANRVAIALNGAATAAEYELSLDVLPVESDRLPEADQDLEQMNPVLSTVALPEAPAPSVEAEYLLDRCGAALVAATLREKPPGRVVSRALANVALTRGDVRPLELTILQPYVTTEPALPTQVVVNLDKTALTGAQLRVAIVDTAGTEIYAAPAQAAGQPFDASLPLGDLPLGDYRVVATVASAAGEVLASEERELKKHEPFGEPMKVEIRDDGLCYVNGTSLMPLGFMLASPDKAIPEAGYNIALYGGETLEGRNHLDTAAENGVWAMLHICNYLRGKYDYDSIRAVVSLRKTEPALFAWYLADEPEGYGDTPDVLRKAYDIIKAIDPNHPVVVLTNVPAMLSQYEGCADVVLTDPYPIPDLSLSVVADWTDATVAAAAAHGQAAWMTPQGFGWGDISESDKPSPACEELSNMLYTCLIHGAKGIIWWPYNTPRQNYWPHFRRMGRECRFVEPWILYGGAAPGMPAGIQADGDVHWRAWDRDGAVLVLAANLARQSRRVAFALPDGAKAVSFPFDADTDALHGGAVEPAQEVVELTLAPVQSIAVVIETSGAATR